jgi:hypothetical protein
MGHMITNNADLTTMAGAGELGWSWKSVKGAVKKVGKAAIVNPTKFVAQKTIIDPTKMVAKSAVGVAKSSAAVGTNIARGRFKEAAKSAGRVALAPARLAVDTTKHAAKTGYAVSKAVTNVALKPLRTRLNTLKDRRAKKIAFDKRRSTVPTVAERAQARKDVKAYLSAKGPHGKMLSYLAGPDYYDGLGVVGYDDAAIAAVATALTASLVKMIGDAAKSKFAPADAVKAGAAAGGTVVAQTAAAKLAPVAQTVQKISEEAAALPVTAEEVAQETAVAAEEAATEAATEAMEGALESAGLLAGFREAVPEAAVPAAMSMSTARKLAGAAQRAVCGMPASAIAAIGGSQAVNVVGSFCRALAAGDDAGVRAALPGVVRIASRTALDVASQALTYPLPNEGFGCSSCFGRAPGRGKKAGRYSPFATCVAFKVQSLGYSRQDALAACATTANLSGDEIGLLAAFAGADIEGLSYGLAGVDAQDISAAADAAGGSVLALLPAGLAVLAGLWMATH